MSGWCQFGALGSVPSPTHCSCRHPETERLYWKYGCHASCVILMYRTTGLRGRALPVFPPHYA